MKILLTAFEPFGGDDINASAEALRLIKAPEGAELFKIQVPTVFGLAGDVVIDAVRKLRPDAVVCLGQAAGRDAITPERIAINVRDARIPDNAGQKPEGEPVVPDGPAAYFSTLPLKAMVKAAADAGIRASASNSAGAFVCNDLMYSVLHALGTEFKGARGGFIHVPALSKGEGGAAMSLEDIVSGTEAMLRAIAES